MREISITECEGVAGAGAIGELGRIFIGEVIVEGAKWVYSFFGVQGNKPPANENDNGGTSYGLGTYNTFGALFSEESSDMGDFDFKTQDLALTDQNYSVAS